MPICGPPAGQTSASVLVADGPPGSRTRQL